MYKFNLQTHANRSLYVMLQNIYEYICKYMYLQIEETGATIS